MNADRVAIVITSWNRKNDLIECLDSLGALSAAPGSVIVVDNGSTDGTGRAAAERFPGVTVLSSPVNLGFAGGNNLGIRKARKEGYEFIFLLNNDTVVPDGFLDPLLRAAEKFPRAAILGPRILYYRRPEIIWSEGIAVGRWSGRVRAQNYREQNAGAGGPAAAAAISGAAMLLRTAALDRVGFFDENFFLCYEDIDLCLRARAAGWEVMTVGDSRIRHKVSGSMGGEGSAMVVYYATRNQLLAFNRNCPVPALWRPIRNLLILSYTLLFAGSRAQGPLAARLRAWKEGVRDYFRRSWGKRSD